MSAVATVVTALLANAPALAVAIVSLAVAALILGLAALRTLRWVVGDAQQPRISAD